MRITKSFAVGMALAAVSTNGSAFGESSAPAPLFPLAPLFAEPVDGPLPDADAWLQVSHLIDRESWAALQPVHRRMIVRAERQRRLDPSIERPVMCFTEGYPDKAIAAFQRSVWGSDEKFRLGGRWTSTATNLSIARGEPFTIVYSYLPDGTSIPGNGGEPTSNSELFSFFETDCGYSRATWQMRFDEVFERWGELTGITYVKLATTDGIDDGAAFPGSAGSLGVRGDVRIGGHSIDGQSGSNTLAYNFFPNTSDMVIDTDNITFFSGTTSLSLGLRNVVSHEHGHGMGFNHVCPINATKLMEPFVSTAYDGPQDDDIQAAQRNYGDPFEQNDTSGTATSLGALASSASVVDVSVDGTDDPDWYSFTLAGAGTFGATLAPVGSSYLEGAQNGDGSCSAGSTVDSRTNANLSLELRDSGGTAILALANSAAAGSSEVLSGVSLAAGTYKVRVAPGATDNVQRYTLGLTFSAGAVTSTNLGITKTDGLTTVNPGGAVSYTIAVSNSGSSADGARIVDALPSQLTSATWTASYGGGAAGPGAGAGSIDTTITTLPSGGSATFTVSATVSSGAAAGTMTNTAYIVPPAGKADSAPANNSATDTTTILSDLPNDSEEFDAFTGMSGGTTSSSNDTGTGFSRSGAFTSTGFTVDTTQSQNGRGMTFTGAETRNIFNTSELAGGGGYSGSSHMIAFWFRMDSISAQSNGTWTQLVTVNNKSGSALAYQVLVGRHSDGAARFRVVGPNTTSSSVSILTFSSTLTTETWHRCIMQYTAASDASTAPTTKANLLVWLDPASAASATTFNWASDFANNMTSQFGTGALGKYFFGQTFASSVVGTGGGQVWIDTVGTWNGFGTTGVNDLQAAIDYLGEAANTAPTVTDANSNITVTRGGSASSTVVATISDAQDARSALVTGVTGDTTGLTVTANSFNTSNGQYTYGVQADCLATLGARTFTVTATDTFGLSSDATFTVTVNANASPTLGTYTNLTLAQGASDTRTPTSPPADSNGSVSSVAVSPTSLAGGGTVAVASGTGVVTVTTAAGTDTGTQTITVTVHDNCGISVQRTFDLTVNSPSVPEIAVEDGGSNIADGGGPIDLGTTTQGASALSKTFTVKNTGTATLTTSTPTVPSGYSITEPLSSSIGAGADDTFTVELSTASTGTFAGSISFANNDGDENPFNFSVTGTITAPEIAVEDGGSNIADGGGPIDLGTTTQGASALSKTFTVKNTGDATLTTSGLTVPSGYSITEPLSSSIGAGADDTFTVELSTASTGTFAGSISFANNDGDENPFNFSVTGTVTAPEIVVEDDGSDIADGGGPISFGTTTQGASALSKTFTVNNTGDATLTTSGLTVPSGYSITEPLSSSIGAGADDTFTVELSTASTGTFAGSISFANNDGDENPFNFSVTGTITAPEVAVEDGGSNIADGGGPIDLGTTTQGASALSKTFTVKNTGTSALATSGLSVPAGYSVTEGLSASIAAGANDTFTVELSTASLGTFSGSISFANDDGDENPFDFSVTGTINDVPVPEIGVADGGTGIANGGGPVDFGTVARGGVAPTKTFTVNNAGTAALTTSGLAVPTGYSITEGLDASIAAGGSDTFTVALSTATAGTFSGSIEFENNDGDEGSFAFSVTGTVTAPEVALADGVADIADGSGPVDFGSVSVGATAPSKTFTVSNSGNIALATSALSVPGGYIVTDGLDASIAPSSSDTFTVELATTAAGTFAGSISFANDDSDENPFNFTVTGTVTAPEVSVADGGSDIPDGGGPVDFGTTTQGSAPLEKTFTVGNSGTEALATSGLSVPAGFAVTEPLSASIPAGGSDNFTVSFDPATPGFFEGTIEFANGDADENPFSFDVTATVTGSDLWMVH